MMVELATGDVYFSTLGSPTTGPDWDDEDYGRCYIINSGPSSIASWEDHRFGPRGVFHAALDLLSSRVDDLVTSVGGTASSQDLQFRRIQTAVLSTLVSAVGVNVNEPFAADTGQYTRLTDSTAMPTFGIGSGVLTIGNNAGAARTDMVQFGSSLNVPLFAAQVDITARTASSTYDFCEVGILKDSSNFIMVAHEKVANLLSIRVKISGSETAYLSLSLSLNAPFKLGISIVCNRVCAYTDTGSGWVYRGAQDISSKINMKSSSLSGWKPALLTAMSNNGSVSFDNFLAGTLGGFGWRDFTMVTNEDGSPYIESGLAYFTAACNDGYGDGYQGVFSLDLSTYAATQISALLASRSGSVQNDGAFHLIRYSASSWKVLWTTWGNGFGGAIDTWLASDTQSLLTAGVYTISGGSKLTLPYQGSGAAYDAMLRKEGSTWKLTYAVSTSTSFTGDPFFPCMAHSSDLSTWTGIASCPSDRPYEGTKWVVLNGGYYVAAGGANVARLYDSELNFRGFIHASFDGGTVTFPHPMIFETESKIVMLTWNQNLPSVSPTAGKWGEMVVHEAGS